MSGFAHILAREHFEIPCHLVSMLRQIESIILNQLLQFCILQNYSYSSREMNTKENLYINAQLCKQVNSIAI